MEKRFSCMSGRGQQQLSELYDLEQMLIFPEAEDFDLNHVVESPMWDRAHWLERGAFENG